MYKRQGQKKPKINHQIKTRQVRLIDEQGENLGIVDLSEALKKAQERNIDLIEVAPQANPPVCRIMDYGKYQYQQNKQERKKKSHQKQTETKGIRISFRIGQHDLEMKANQAKKFLDNGNKVRVEMILKGREKAQMPKAKEKFHSFIETVSPEVTIEGEIKKNPRGLNAVIAYKQ